MGWFSSAFEGLLGVGSVDSMTPTAVLRQLPVRDEYTEAEAKELDQLASEDPAELVRVLNEDGHTKWAAAVRSAVEAGVARDDRHLANVKQTGRDIGRDARTVGRTGASWLPVVGILAAVVLLTQARR
jgi:hypothetical protein